MRHIVSTTLLLVLVLAFSSYAAANAVTYSGSSGGLSASATFNLTGSTLTVTLTNTSTGNATDAAEILLAVLFDTSTSLTPVSASVGASTVYGPPAMFDVGKGWEYKSGVSVHGMNSGISGAGYGVFGPKGNFHPSPDADLDGSDYGIAPIGFTNMGNPSVEDPIIKNSIVFTLSAPGFSLSELDPVYFQYGTSLTEPSFVGTPVPEPSTLALFGAGVLGMTRFIRRRLR